MKGKTNVTRMPSERGTKYREENETRSLYDIIVAVIHSWCHTFSGFPEHWITFYQVWYTVAWWFGRLRSYSILQKTTLTAIKVKNNSSGPPWAGLRQPRVSAKFEFRYESLKHKFSFILFVYNLMIGCSKKNWDNYPRKCFWTNLTQD